MRPVVVVAAAATRAAAAIGLRWPHWECARLDAEDVELCGAEDAAAGHAMARRGGDGQCSMSAAGVVREQERHEHERHAGEEKPRGFVVLCRL